MNGLIFLALPCLAIGAHAEAANTLPPPPVTRFTQEDSLSVSRPGPIVGAPNDCPKQNDDPYFRNHALTVARSHGGGTCAPTTWSGLVSGDLWTNRCKTAQCGRVKPKSIIDEPEDENAIDGQQNLHVRLIYSSIANADAATLAELDWWLGGTHWLSFTGAVGIPDDHVYTCITDPCHDGSRAFMDDVNDDTIQMQGWSPTGSPPWDYAVPTSDYVVMPQNQLTNDPSALLTDVVQLDYEGADRIRPTF